MTRVGRGTGSFSEREFYLREFRGRTMAIAVETPEAAPELAPVLETLAAGECRVVLLTRPHDALDELVDGRWLRHDTSRFEAEVWHRLRAAPRLGVRIEVDGFLDAVRELAVRLGVFKLVLLDPEGGLPRAGPARSTCVDAAALEGLLESGRDELAPRLPLLRAIRTMLEAGVPAVNVCAAGGLAAELFTYAGSGTLFTRESYVRVRRLGVDDFDAAADLMARGVEEGFLLARSQAEVDQVLAHAFGAFVEDRYLAGIAALQVDREAGSGELVALYAITRFLGEGIGTHLVAFAAERARALGLEALVACTVSEPAVAFFQRQGFERIAPDQLPARRWAGYAPARRDRLVCLRRDLMRPTRASLSVVPPPGR